MPTICEISDFTGDLALSFDNFTKAKFDAVRNEVEPKVIYQLLGAELGALFLSDLNVSGVPVTARFLSIYNAFAEDDGSDVVYSEGLKEYVKRCVYMAYVGKNAVRVALSGNAGGRSENSTNSVDHLFIVTAYNKGISIGRNIQWKICNNSADYPEYNGQMLKFSSYV